MAEPHPLSPRARAVLAKAGWTEAYACPRLEEYCRALVDDGYEVSEAAREFLRRFGGLDVVIPHPPVPGRTERFHTRADDAVASTFSDTAELWGEIVGAPVCLVGEVWTGHMGMAMDARGRVFAGEGVLVVHLGDSGEEAVEKLCTERRLALDGDRAALRDPRLNQKAGMIGKDEVAALVAEQVALIEHPDRRDLLLRLLVEPRREERDWDYGPPGQRYPYWVVAEAPEEGTLLVYCEEGFGPSFPWGFLFADEPEFTSLGMDSQWDWYLEGALVRSGV